jgi:glycosyltransferase involved in cell wall biosynthesis
MASESPVPGITIIICTRSRARSLERTLRALARIAMPPALAAEILVVNNGSTDDTAAVVREARTVNASIDYLHEPHGGQTCARNAGLASARGDLIVFTDDDVRPERGWLERLCAPLLAGTADAVVGTVRIAPHLERPWMQALHRAWLADTACLDAGAPSRLIGANMAFRRAVLERVPGFDPELGPGAIGFGDDTLFSLQLREAGFRISAAFDAVVEHHFDERRLATSHWLANARRMGHTDAYLAHHWENAEWSRPEWLVVKAALRWLTCGAAWLRIGPVPESVLVATRHLHAGLRYLRERHRPRNYAPRGLIRLAPACRTAPGESRPVACEHPREDADGLRMHHRG